MCICIVTKTCSVYLYCYRNIQSVTLTLHAASVTLPQYAGNSSSEAIEEDGYGTCLMKSYISRSKAERVRLSVATPTPTPPPPSSTPLEYDHLCPVEMKCQCPVTGLCHVPGLGHVTGTRMLAMPVVKTILVWRWCAWKRNSVSVSGIYLQDIIEKHKNAL